jgi:hypothetical protein
MILSVITQVVSYILWDHRINNLPALHIFTILEYLLVLWYFSRLLNDFFPKWSWLFLAAAFPLYSIADSIWIEPINTFNSYSRTVEALIIIFLSVCWFVKNLTFSDTGKPMQTSSRYIVSGFLIYFTGSLVLFSFGNYINKLMINLVINIWMLHTLLDLILYLLITIGLWKQRKG